MNETISFWTMAIVAIFSAAMPLITAALNNAHEKSMYKHRFYDEHRAQAIERYLDSAASVIISRFDTEQYLAYSSSYGEALMYLPEELRADAMQLNDLIIKAKRDEALEAFNMICEKLPTYYEGRKAVK